MKFVNPKNDVAFRKIFGTQEKSESLISFLNAVLGLSGDKALQAVQILNPYQTPKLEKLKTTILDVRATDHRGVSFIVEMQIAHTVGIRKRFTYYLAKAYSSQIERGEDYPKLNQVIFIGVLDFVLFEDNEKTGRYLSRHQILDTETHRQQFTDLELTFIELPHFTKQADEVTTLLDKWLYYIKHADDLEIIPAHVDDAGLQQAYRSADQFGWSREDLEAYEYRGMRIQDERGAIEHAHQKGRQEGLEEGHKTGLEEGHQAGLEEGHKAARLETAANLLAMGLSLEQVAQATGLTIEELNNLT